MLLILAFLVVTIVILLIGLVVIPTTEKMVASTVVDPVSLPSIREALAAVFSPLSCLQGKSYDTNFGKIPCRMPSGDYNQATAKYLFRIIMNIAAGNCSYLGPVPFPDGFNAHRLKAVTPITLQFHRKRIFGFVLTSGDPCDVAIVAYSGTLYWDEWLADAMFPQVAPEALNNYREGMRVHNGFYGIYMAIRAQLQRWIPTNAKRLIICGHSMGAALATLTAFDFAAYGPEVYAFAPPRVGNNAFANKSAQLLPKAFKIINTADLIPTLPPPVFPNTTYTHTGTVIPFIRNLGSIGGNHVEAYKQFLGL